MTRKRVLSIKITLLLFLSPVTSRAAQYAEAYDVTVELRDNSIVAVPFLRCLTGQVIPKTETAPETCKERDPDRNFSVHFARITNMGTTPVWLYIDHAKVPILPGGHTWQASNRALDRAFISGEAGALVHVYASQYPRVNESHTYKSQTSRSQTSQ